MISIGSTMAERGAWKKHARALVMTTAQERLAEIQAVASRILGVIDAAPDDADPRDTLKLAGWSDDEIATFLAHVNA